jgi:geranylgeranyl diphosphate synthase type I
VTVVGDRVHERVDRLLAEEQERWSAVDPDLRHPLEALRDFVGAGGKRLRPTFCYWAFVGAGGDPADPRIVDAGGALELLHTFAIIHDDVMDGSDQRRRLPTMHRTFIGDHVEGGWRGESRRFGEGAAVLVGDLAAMYGDVLLRSVPAEAHVVYDELRIELCAGQYLDLVGAVQGPRLVERAERIERYKSAKYTVERPLQFGAAVAGRLEELAEALSAVGLPLGEAFQLRDDLLGVFGDPAATGKPVGDDLRGGKLTPLLAAGVARVPPGEADPFARLGAVDLDDAEIDAMQEFLVSSGAVAKVEEDIERRFRTTLDAIRSLPFDAQARTALEELASYAAFRDH